MPDYSTLSTGPHAEHVIAPDGWCFDCAEFVVNPNVIEVLLMARTWLSHVPTRQDPTTRLMRRLTECLVIANSTPQG